MRLIVGALPGLLEEGVQLYLVDGRRDSGGANQQVDMTRQEVADADVLDDALLLRVDERLPRLDELALRRVGPMNQIQVDVYAGAPWEFEAPDEENIELIRTSKRSRLPVCVGSLDNVKGVCSTKMLLQQILDSGKPDFANNLMPVSYVPESLTGMELLEHFRKTDVPLALVVDEYGEVLGLVTPRDVLEAIAGEFKPEQPDDSWATRREDGSWLLDGIIPIPEMKDVLSLKHVPEEEAGRYSTLAGMVMLLLGRLPKEGDAVEWLGWRFEIVDMDGRRVDKVLASRLRAAHGMAEVVPKGEELSPQIERGVVDNPHDGADSKTIKSVDKSVGN